MGLLSRVAQHGARRAVTLADMDKSIVNAASRRGIESNVDPRLILGAGGVGAMTAAPATASALDAIRPYERAAQDERRLEQHAELMNQALRLRMMGYSSRDVQEPMLQAALAQLEHQAQQPSQAQQALEPGAQGGGLPDNAYAGRPGFFPRDSGG